MAVVEGAKARVLKQVTDLRPTKIEQHLVVDILAERSAAIIFMGPGIAALLFLNFNSVIARDAIRHVRPVRRTCPRLVSIKCLLVNKGF